MHITVTHDDGSTVDITEGVQVAYDTAYGSMDWGSGFLDLEEMDAIARLAEACRFPSFEAALTKVADQRAAEEMRQADRMSFAQKERIRRETEAKVKAHLAAEMREKEPALVRAGWTDDQLVRLHHMRNSGVA